MSWCNSIYCYPWMMLCGVITTVFVIIICFLQDRINKLEGERT